MQIDLANFFRNSYNCLEHGVITEHAITISRWFSGLYISLVDSDVLVTKFSFPPTNLSVVLSVAVRQCWPLTRLSTFFLRRQHLDIARMAICPSFKKRELGTGAGVMYPVHAETTRKRVKQPCCFSEHLFVRPVTLRFNRVFVRIPERSLLPRAYHAASPYR